MDLQPVIDFLLKLGVTPLEIITLVAVVVLYRDNRLLFDKVLVMQKSVDECLDKIPSSSVNK